MKTSARWRPRRSPQRPAAMVTTLVSVGDQVVRLAQVRQAAQGPVLLALKVRPTASVTAESLRALVRTLPAPVGRVLLVLAKAQVLTRSVTLPADDPGELVTMARYALADTVPYALDDCVVAVQPLQSREKKTQVLAVITPKATLDRLLALLRPSGLTPHAIALSAEGLARWHQRLAPGVPKGGPRLVLEMLGDTLELAIVEDERLWSLRSLPWPVSTGISAPWLVTQVQETLHGYTQDRVGPPVAALTVSGPLLSQQGIVATLAEHVNLPVTVADPTVSPFTQTLAHEAAELTAQPWSDLFGLALASTPLALDLLPAEVKQAQVRETIRHRTLELVMWCGICAWLGAGLGVVGALRQGRLQHRLRQEQTTVAAPARRAAALAEYLARLRERTPAYVAAITVLSDLQSAGSAAVTLDHFSLDATTLTVSGTAPTLGDAMALVAELQRHPALHAAALRTATADRAGRLHFLVEVRR